MIRKRLYYTNISRMMKEHITSSTYGYYDNVSDNWVVIYGKVETRLNGKNEIEIRI